MPCYYPLKGWVVGHDVQTGKKIVKVTSAVDVGYPGCESFPVPCGNCLGCRLEYSKQWANRCMMEAQYHGRSCFVTLTYADSHIPQRFYNIRGHCCSVPALSLCKRDLQLFFKRLRKAHPQSHIRYFGCGEYGPTTLRPHYHIILFGIDFDDKVLYRKSKTGNDMFTSADLDRCWSFPALRGELVGSGPSVAGLATVQPMTWETCAYTARYVTKKLKGPLASFYTEHNMEPPFCCMSRRPGIGRQYYDEHPELWDYEYINISTPDGGKKFRPPKYFMKLFEQDDPYSAEALKDVRKAFALQQSEVIEDLSLVPYDEYLNREGVIKESTLIALKRDSV